MSDWISVEDLLPELIWTDTEHEYAREVIAADREGNVFSVDYARHGDGFRWQVNQIQCGNDITHWREMPEHPHPEWFDEYMAKLEAAEGEAF